MKRGKDQQSGDKNRVTLALETEYLELSFDENTHLHPSHRENTSIHVFLNLKFRYSWETNFISTFNSEERTTIIITSYMWVAGIG